MFRAPPHRSTAWARAPGPPWWPGDARGPVKRAVDIGSARVRRAITSDAPENSPRSPRSPWPLRGANLPVTTTRRGHRPPRSARARPGGGDERAGAPRRAGTASSNPRDGGRDGRLTAITVKRARARARITVERESREPARKSRSSTRERRATDLERTHRAGKYAQCCAGPTARIVSRGGASSRGSGFMPTSWRTRSSRSITIRGHRRHTPHFDHCTTWRCVHAARNALDVPGRRGPPGRPPRQPGGRRRRSSTARPARHHCESEHPVVCPRAASGPALSPARPPIARLAVGPAARLRRRAFASPVAIAPRSHCGGRRGPDSRTLGDSGRWTR